MIKHRLVSMPVVAIATALVLGGCASTEEIKKLRAEVEGVKGTAEAAQTSANNAQASADRAQKTASQALQAARDAQACCDANTERLNRAFERSMLK